MSMDKILDLFKNHKYMELEENGFLTPGMVAYAFNLGVISRSECEELTGWFY